MDPITRALMMGAAGAGGAAAKTYIEDVFSTWLYTGTSSTQTITNGIDLAGKGGLVWTKSRSNPTNHGLYDTVRGNQKLLVTNANVGELTYANDLTSFNADGYTLASGGSGYINDSGRTYVSWTFREAAKFFDVVTYTGNGSNRTIAHSLGSVPGTIIVKRTDTTADWQVYHRSLANTEYLVLNSTAAKATGATRWNSTTPTSTEFSLGTDATVNASGGIYVAYLFAHDAGGFGDSGNDNVVSCGSFTTDGSGNATVTLGWEPQWVLVKPTSGASNWIIYDTMRGFDASTSDKAFAADSASSEFNFNVGSPIATGFAYSATASANATHIYIAIRRGPMKTPTDATKVFETIARSGTSAVASVGSLQSPDLAAIHIRNINDLQGRVWVDRLRGPQVLRPNNSNAEQSTNAVLLDRSTGVGLSADGGGTTVNQSSNTYSQNHFRRAPGFFDVVAYTGNNANSRAIAHNLGVAPQMVIVKSRSSANRNWPVQHINYGSYFGKGLYLDLSGVFPGDSATFSSTIIPTASNFYLADISNAVTNFSGENYIAYLFASCPGVSKVGSYTGTGTTLSIDCGFTTGARFVMIKRTDSTGDWYVWDAARGIIAANDPYLLLNSTAAEVTNTDFIDPLSSGFQISSTAPAAINANGGSYIYLSVA